MSNSMIVGPILGFEEGDFYTICVLLAPGGAPPTLELPGRQQTHPFARVATVGDNEFWRAEFASPPPAAGVFVDYVIKVNGAPIADQHDRNEWKFYVPGKGEQPLIAYASCNGFSSAKLARDTDDPYRLWKRMAKTHNGIPATDGKPEKPARPFSLLLMGGDQVYADELWESKRCPSLKKWSDLNWKKQNEAKVTAGMKKEIAAFYDWLYTDRWSDENMSLMFASIPSVMMWDDHDIFDGWGSYPEERQTCDVFKEAFSHASRVYDIFQLRCSTRNRLNPDASHRTLRLRFRDYTILALDNRSDRTMTQIMSEANWQDVKDWLTGMDGQAIPNLLVMAGVPVVYRSFATVEAIMDATPSHEEVEDDVHDHWSSRPHLAERMRLVMVLLNFLEKPAQKNCKAILLSGDVHVGALGQIWNERKCIGMTQIISSGIVHPPPTAFTWAGVQLMTSDTPEALGDGEVTAEMLTPLSSPRYLRTRNFATLQTGTDNKLWINWICEDSKLKPSFAVANVDCH
jgi:hypothetical protein